MNRLLLIVLTLVSLGSVSQRALADRRVALVIGNASYENISRLDNPRNDAALIANTLREVGFILVGGSAQVDLDKSALDRAVQNFGRQIQGADVALFYYSGHGVQVDGSNFLVPVNANPARRSDVDFQMVDVNLVLHQMQDAKAKLNLVILDACRNNPFGGRGLRAVGSGLAQLKAPEGSLISYATQPGAVALDGTDGNSPYSRALATTIRKPGLDIFQTFNQVGLAVKRSTSGEQQPWVSSSPIEGNFYFVPSPHYVSLQQSDPPESETTGTESREKLGDQIDTLKSLEDAAKAGDAKAMVRLGLLSERGDRVPKNYDKARQWYEKASSSGSNAGTRNLGILYRDGLGIPKDPVSARRLFERAANNGHAPSMTSLGLLYETGNGIAQNLTVARQWYEKAADAGDVSGMRNLALMYLNGDGGAKDPAQARSLFERAALKGHAASMTNLGLLYERGSGGPQDFNEARKWYEKASASGDAAAMTNLGVMYARGQGVDQNLVEARRWYEKAAVAGSAVGMANLGYLYRDGRGVPKDVTQARNWLKRAADAGNEGASIALAKLNRSGKQ